MGPVWAVLCGTVASGGLTARWETALPLLLAAFVADPLWGALWTLVAETDWLLVLDDPGVRYLALRDIVEAHSEFPSVAIQSDLEIVSI